VFYSTAKLELFTLDKIVPERPILIELPRGFAGHSPSMTTGARAHLRSVPVAELTDEDLVRLTSEGNERAFSALYRKHSRYVAGVAYRILGSPDEVDDVVQETFVAALKGIATLQEPAALRRWLVTIATRQVHRRLAIRIKKQEAAPDLREYLGDRTDAATALQVDELYDVLDKMEPKLRIPWTLVRIEGQALGEAADICEISLATLKRRVATAEERIRRRLGHG